MNIGEFSALSREEQLAEAGRIANGTDPSVFVGMHRVESAGGTQMLSPAGAEGHFGLMPKTRAVWEKRFGAKVDPMDYGQSLFTAAHTLKENLGRFKNLPDALRAYNGGWDPATWGNKETAAYAGLVLGTDVAPVSEANASTAAALPSVVARADTLWDTPGARAGKPAKPGKSTEVKDATAAYVQTLSGAPAAPTARTFGAGADETGEQQARQRELDAERGFFVKAGAAFSDGLFGDMYRAVTRDREEADPEFRVDEAALKGRSKAEQQDLRAAVSKVQFDRIMREQDEHNSAGKVTFSDGIWSGLAATMFGAAPEAIITGGIASGLFRVGGIGAYHLAREGKTAQAISSLAAEGIVGNVATTAAMDMLGHRQGASDYAMGVAGGLLNPLFGARSAMRAADHAEAARSAQLVIAQAASNEQALLNRATERAGTLATPDEIRRHMDIIEAEDARAPHAAAVTPVDEARKIKAGGIDEILEEQAKLREAGAAGSADMRAEGNASTSVPTARWEDPNFQRARVDRLKFDENWRSGVKRTLDNEFDADAIEALPGGVHVTQAAAANPKLARQINDITELSQKYGLGKVVIGSGNTDPNAQGIAMSFGDTHVIGLSDKPLKTDRAHTAWHEIGHAIYHQHAPTAPVELMGRIDGEWKNFVAQAIKRDPAAWEKRWALTSPNTQVKDPALTAYNLDRDEFMAEQFVKHLQSAAMSGRMGNKLSKSVLDSISEAIANVLDYVKSLIDKGYVKPGKAADEFFSQILEGGFAKKAKGEQFLAPELKLPSLDELGAKSVDVIPDDVRKQVELMQTDPTSLKHGLNNLPMSTPAERAEALQILDIWKKADSEPVAVNKKALNRIFNNKFLQALNPTSNTMLRSKNPVLNMAAAELVENAGGAAGRRSTASISKHLNERAIIGDSINQTNNAFKAWFRKQEGISFRDEALSNKGRDQFDRLVAEEIEYRRMGGDRPDLGENVRAAADAMEAAFERSRVRQVQAQTLGWQNLSESAKGYLPHRMRSDAYRALTLEQKNALQGELADQFVTVSGFDPEFSMNLAARYLDRVNKRALGGVDAPMALHQPGAAEVVREALTAAGLTREQVQQQMGKFTRGAAAHTKRRLNLNLMKEIESKDGKNFKLIDLYETNSLKLLRGQASRVSGEVALAQHGIMGKPGLAILRRAAEFGDTTETATRAEMEAFDQIGAELLGEPFGTQSKPLDRVVKYTSLASLGGMGFNQLSEVMNGLTTLGLKGLTGQLPELARVRSEVLKLARGEKVDNSLLTSIETMSGVEFGLDAYKFVFPWDNPDLPTQAMGYDSLNFFDKAANKAGELQAKYSGWRAIHAAQVRSAAEQLVLKIARFSQEGKPDKYLEDIGISAEVFARLKKDMPNIVKWKDGKVDRFDITKATDSAAANELIQAVHRGAAQIIQGSFIGESGKYMHSSLGRLFAQFRNFSILSVDKQIARRVGMEDYSGLALTAAASFAAAMPIQYARYYAASIGRKDQEEYLNKQLSFSNLSTGALNYMSVSGLGGDAGNVVRAFMGLGTVAGRSGSESDLFGNIIAPSVGKVDKLWQSLQDTKEGVDPKPFLKAMPLSNLPGVLQGVTALTN